MTGGDTAGLTDLSGLVSLLDGPRAQGAFTLRTVMQPPWSLRIAAEAPLTLIVMIRGSAGIIPDTGTPVRLQAGDLAITRAPDHYTMADPIDMAPTVVIHRGQRCCDLSGASLLETMTHGVRTWGNDPDGPTLFLVGAYEALSAVSGRLQRSLPPVLAIPGQDFQSPLVPLLLEEVGKDEPGQGAVLDRLLDLLLVAALKTWLNRPAGQACVWRRSQGDPVVERALRALHRDPARAWTLADLASAAGTSRAALARHFRDVVGAPPMTVLTTWRMARAADLLTDPAETVGTVAEKVGYASPYAFSAAFKRVRGLSPQAHRAQTL